MWFKDKLTSAFTSFDDALLSELNELAVLAVIELGIEEISGSFWLFAGVAWTGWEGSLPCLIFFLNSGWAFNFSSIRFTKDDIEILMLGSLIFPAGYFSLFGLCFSKLTSEP
jgi:hypothetical protein